MKEKNKDASEIKPTEFSARKQHRAVVQFLGREPLCSRLIKWIPRDSTAQILLTKLLNSDGPVSAKEAAENTYVAEKAISPAATRLNEYLDDFLGENLKVLAAKEITIKIPRPSRGGHFFGYYLSCYDHSQNKFLDDARSLEVLEEAYENEYEVTARQELGSQVIPSTIQYPGERIG